MSAGEAMAQAVGGAAGFAGLLALAAGMLAMGAGAFLGDWAYRTAKRRTLAASMLAPTRRDQVLLRLRGGVAPLRAPARKLLASFAYVDDACQCASVLLQERGLDFDAEALLSLLLAASGAAVVAGTVLSGSPTFGIAAGCIVFIGATAWAKNRSERRNLAMREEIPDVLRTVSMSFRSGHSLPQTLAEASKEADGYLGRLFSVASDRLEMGATTTEALSVMRSNARLPELAFVAVALDVQHQSGGSIAPVLESATESIEGELKLMRSLRVQTAQAKLSASIVTVMPFILVALFSLMSPDFLAPFFSSLLGMAVLGVALLMQCAGVLAVRRILKVEAA